MLPIYVVRVFAALELLAGLVLSIYLIADSSKSFGSEYGSYRATPHTTDVPELIAGVFTILSGMFISALLFVIAGMAVDLKGIRMNTESRARSAGL
ncbi:MAG TPA: hypothetical protein VNN73_01925 [Blastocatellia bacterium]|nr:hypothetical protein [Blastocatellia bacterium]